MPAKNDPVKFKNSGLFGPIGSSASTGRTAFAGWLPRVGVAMAEVEVIQGVDLTGTVSISSLGESIVIQ